MAPGERPPGGSVRRALSGVASRQPIMLGYWTAEVNSRAQRVLRNDLYSLYAQLLAALRRRPN